MSPEAREAADIYYKTAASWASDRSDDLRASRRVAWIIALIACFVALALAIVLLVLLPLKTVIPYTLMVDRQTGHVQALEPLEANRVAPDTALTQSFLVQYVIAREGFDIATVQNDYRKVSLWSADSAKADYVAMMPVKNLDSPLVRLPRNTIVETRVRSVSALANRTALVRFETIRRDRGGVPQVPQSWVAIISYRFSTAPLSIEDRFTNPLGFQVVRYRRNAETPPMSTETPPVVGSSAPSTSVGPTGPVAPVTPAAVQPPARLQP